MITKTKDSMFRSIALREAPTQGVDRKKNCIMGAKVIQLGAINDERPWVVDATTMAQVIKMGNQTKSGLKARYTHPNLSDDGLGSFLGRWKNFRQHNDAVIADLYISDSAFESPRGDLGGYILDLAENDPDMFGVSLASIIDEELMAKERDAVPPSKDGEDKPRLSPLRFKRLYAADAVDTPAATRDGLFASEIDEHTLPELATFVMDHFFIGSPRHEVLARFEAFLGKYYSGGSDMTVQAIELAEVVITEVETETVTTESECTTTITDDSTATEEEPVVNEAAQPMETAQELAVEVAVPLDRELGKEFIRLFGNEGAAWFLDGKSLNECFQMENSNLRQVILMKNKEITKLEARLGAATLAAGEAEPLSAEPLATAASKKQAKLADAEKKGISPPEAAWAASMYPDK